MDTTEKDSQLLESNVDAIKCRHGRAYTLIDEQICGSRSVELSDEVGIMAKVSLRIFQVYVGGDSLEIFVGNCSSLALYAC